MKISSKTANIIHIIFADIFVITGFTVGWIFECLKIGFNTGRLVNLKLIEIENENKHGK